MSVGILWPKGSPRFAHSLHPTRDPSFGRGRSSQFLFEALFAPRGVRTIIIFSNKRTSSVSQPAGDRRVRDLRISLLTIPSAVRSRLCPSRLYAHNPALARLMRVGLPLSLTCTSFHSPRCRMPWLRISLFVLELQLLAVAARLFALLRCVLNQRDQSSDSPTLAHPFDHPFDDTVRG